MIEVEIPNLTVLELRSTPELVAPDIEIPCDMIEDLYVEKRDQKDYVWLRAECAEGVIEGYLPRAKPAEAPCLVNEPGDDSQDSQR